MARVETPSPRSSAEGTVPVWTARTFARAVNGSTLQSGPRLLLLSFVGLVPAKAWRDGVPRVFATQATLAEQTGAAPRSVRRWLRALERFGALRRVGKAERGRVVYDVRPERIPQRAWSENTQSATYAPPPKGPGPVAKPEGEAALTVLGVEQPDRGLLLQHFRAELPAVLKRFWRRNRWGNVENGAGLLVSMLYGANPAAGRAYRRALAGARERARAEAFGTFDTGHHVRSTPDTESDTQAGSEVEKERIEEQAKAGGSDEGTFTEARPPGTVTHPALADGSPEEHATHAPGSTLRQEPLRLAAEPGRVSPGAAVPEDAEGFASYLRGLGARVLTAEERAERGNARFLTRLLENGHAGPRERAS